MKKSFQKIVAAMLAASILASSSMTAFASDKTSSNVAQNEEVERCVPAHLST